MEIDNSAVWFLYVYFLLTMPYFVVKIVGWIFRKKGLID